MTALALAENEPDAREYLTRQLTSDGFDVLAVASAREVFELAARTSSGCSAVGHLPGARDRQDVEPVAGQLAGQVLRASGSSRQERVPS